MQITVTGLFNILVFNHIQTLASNKISLPHNLQDQVPPVHPFDQELPKGNKYCVTLYNLENKMAFKRKNK